eukprot:Hpha_TRINITY_DN17121_c0_g1::TRINITY_DN17121_c0_g1_i1::g.146722::m.146722
MMANEQQMEQFAHLYEGEAFFVTMRQKCWDTCVQEAFDAVAAASNPPQPRSVERLEPYRPCIKRCITRTFKIQEEISEQFVKSMEDMKQRQEAMQQAMGQMGPGMGPPGPQ